MFVVACGGRTQPPPTNTAPTTAAREKPVKYSDDECATDAECGDGLRCDPAPCPGSEPPTDPDVNIYGGLCEPRKCIAK